MKRLSSLMTLLIGLLVGFFCGAIVTAGYAVVQQINYDQVVAMAGETPVTRGQLAERAIYKYGRKILDGELKDYAIVEEAARKAGVNVTQAEVTARMAEYDTLLEEYEELIGFMGSRKSFDATPRWIKEDSFRRALLAEKMLKVTVTDADVQKCYTDQLKHFYRPPMVDLICIATSKEVDARRAWNRLKDGEDAAMLAGLYSSDEVLQQAEGKLGWVPKSAMLPVVSNAIFGPNNGKGLRKGDSTDVIELTNEGTNATEYLIYYIADRKPDSVRKLEEVRPVVELIARSQKLNTAMYAQTHNGKSWMQLQDEQITWKRARNIFEPVSELEVVQPYEEMFEDN